MSAIERISKQQLLEHLILLDPESRVWRFGYSASDAAIEMYVNGIHDSDIILGIRVDITSEVMIAAVHLSIDEEQKIAEIGISTLLASRRLGYGERLLRYSVDILRNRNIRQLYSVCLPDNQPLVKLFRKLNITSITSNAGEKEARINIPMAGIDSVVNELRNERLVVIDKAMKPWAELWRHMFQKSQ